MTSLTAGCIDKKKLHQNTQKDICSGNTNTVTADAQLYQMSNDDKVDYSDKL